ncbi:hypothetical protein C5167_001807 [Papaver somniferum]|uniref:Uncharacterized protein n=1 Tax=Papaver somniferum TaxID=3469 RepID=A0A4Y7KW88_PAPSO|nr:hypothetical protein C5167_001807 [Papaver somniferum]
MYRSTSTTRKNTATAVDGLARFRNEGASVHCMRLAQCGIYPSEKP